jgi:ferritin-like metal-binding protein YciE
MSLDTMRDLFVDELSDIYNAEKQLVKALPKMVKAAESPTLKKALTDHLAETKEHVNRLKEVFSEIGEERKRKECKAMVGLVDEGKQMCKKDGDPDVRDAGIIGAGQRVEHYEIAAYGTVIAFAQALGEAKAVLLLDKTLKEEVAADQRLSGIAEGEVNPAALLAGEDSEENKDE